MDLKTGEEITRGRVTPVPLTDTVKDIVEAMAVSQGITKMKFTNKKGETLAYHNWIAGVDYDAINGPEENAEELQINENFENQLQNELQIDEIFENLRTTL